MSAELLREAAALMRERAENAACAIGEDWRMGDRSTLYTLEFRGNDDVWRNAFDCGPCNDWNESTDVKHEYVGTAEEPAEHIASWHPAVAVAVAEWLDATARELDALNDPPLNDHPLDGRRTAALAVARAYLGRDS